MTDYTLNLQSDTWVNFAPVTLQEEVHQNLRTIITTALGSAPGSRSIGVDFDIVDDPANIAQARITGAIITAVAEQEPRAQITAITFNQQNTESLMYGKLLPAVKYILVGEGI